MADDLKLHYPSINVLARNLKSNVGNDGIWKAIETGLYSFVGKGFVLLDERSRTDHIGMEDNREFSR